jgi:hypothetical protein
MPTLKIPFLRGNTAQNNAYRGAPGEITIDTALGTLRVHNGVTAGGEALLRQSDLDQFVTGTSNTDKRSEVASRTVVYRGEVAPGTAETASGWSIQRITITYGTSVAYQVAWATGTKSFVHKWSLRSTYNYSVLN